MDFGSGAIGTIIQSFDVWSHNLPRIEIYGTEGSLVVPDPNHFTGPVMVRRAGGKEWSNIPLTHSDTIGRGIGVADMAYAIRSRPEEPRQRRPGLPRAGRDVLVRGGLEDLQARRDQEHGRQAGGAAGGPDGGNAG